MGDPLHCRVPVDLRVGNLVNHIIFAPVGDSEFFPLVVTAAIGLMLFRVLLGVTEPPEADEEDEAEDEEEEPTDGRGSAPFAGCQCRRRCPRGRVGRHALHVLLAAPVSANNCSGWGDCPVTMEAVAAAGAGSAAVVAVSAALFAARAAEVSQRRGGSAVPPLAAPGSKTDERSVAAGADGRSSPARTRTSRSASSSGCAGARCATTTKLTNRRLRLVWPLIGLAALFSGVALLGNILAGISLVLSLAFTTALLALTLALIWVRLTGPARQLIASVS